jgi:hypothetical protein
MICLKAALVLIFLGEFDRENLHLHPLISYLAPQFNLYHSCGIVRMMLIDDTARSIYKWVPYDILYGFPLYDVKINKVLNFFDFVQ